MEKFTQRNGNATGCPRQWVGEGGGGGKPAHEFKAKYCRINLANKKLFDLRSAEGRIRLLFCWLFSRLFDFYRFWGFFFYELSVSLCRVAPPHIPRGISQLIVCLTLEWCVHFISISQRSLVRRIKQIQIRAATANNSKLDRKLLSLRWGWGFPSALYKYLRCVTIFKAAKCFHFELRQKIRR